MFTVYSPSLNNDGSGSHIYISGGVVAECEYNYISLNTTLILRLRIQRTQLYEYTSTFIGQTEPQRDSAVGMADLSHQNLIHLQYIQTPALETTVFQFSHKITL